MYVQRRQQQRAAARGTGGTGAAISAFSAPSAFTGQSAAVQHLLDLGQGVGHGGDAFHISGLADHQYGAGVGDLVAQEITAQLGIDRHADRTQLVHRQPEQHLVWVRRHRAVKRGDHRILLTQRPCLRGAHASHCIAWVETPAVVRKFLYQSQILRSTFPKIHRVGTCHQTQPPI
jgi:hypothetical protein